jgi:tRNA(Ser,Leu) C12 N-acetylase TAN1
VHDWNVVAVVRGQGVRRGRAILREFGDIAWSDYLNVLVMRVDDIATLLEGLTERIEADPAILGEALSRLVPAEETFSFQTPEEFEAKARSVVLRWVPRLAGQAFHVRLHRRGFKGRLSSPDEERFLDHVLLESLDAAGTPGSITFDDPDAIIVVETISNRAGLSLWTREQLRRYPFLRLD